MHDSAAHWSAPALDDLTFFRANIVKYAFRRHVHDYFVVGLIEAGVQKFEYRHDTHFTLPTGIILLNPGEPHTGEAGSETGFGYRAFYPDADSLRQIASQVAGRGVDIPFFAEPVIHDPALFETVCAFHRAVEEGSPALEQESRYLAALALLIRRHADSHLSVQNVGRERAEIGRIRQHIHDHYAGEVRLADLAALVHWSPYYLLRAFRHEVGLPPHAYLASVRVREAQRMLRAGLPIAEVAYATGFNSQSHLTTTFKQLIGVTPGHYARQVNF